MKYLLVAFFLTTISKTDVFTEQEKQAAWTNIATASDLGEVEKEVLYYTNLLRSNPKKFNDTYLKNYLDTVSKSYASKNVRSLQRDLKKSNPLPLLQFNKKLTDFAKQHAVSTGKRGKVGHRSIKGKSYNKRIKPLFETFQYVGENIHYGSVDPLTIVIELLIDEGVPDLGHRKNLLDPVFNSAGAALEFHKKYRNNCVIEYGKQL